MFHIIYTMSTGKMPQSSKEGCLHAIRGNFWCWGLKNTAAVLQRDLSEKNGGTWPGK